MIDLTYLNYKIKDDIEFFLEAEQIDIERLSILTSISRQTLSDILKGKDTNSDTLEKFYSFIYSYGYRLNKIKGEIEKERSKEIILFHGSKNGIKELSIENGRNNCDFGKGFYLGETYNNVASFVYNNKNSSIYIFSLNIKDLKIKRIDFSLDWMLLVCFNRKTLEYYKNNEKIQKLIKEIEDVDIIIAPIADNKMFYLMTSFASSDINYEVALHSLSASSLGYQYVLRTEKAIDRLKVIEKLYLSKEEKRYLKVLDNERAKEIETKLKMSKKEFKNGLFIEEILR